MKALIKWIKGFGLEASRENELIEWASGAYGVITVRAIKVAIQEKIDYDC